MSGFRAKGTPYAGTRGRAMDRLLMAGTKRGAAMVAARLQGHGNYGGGTYAQSWTPPLSSFRKGYNGRGRPNMSTRGFVGTVADAKFFDTAVATYEASTTGSITHLNPVPQGTTVNTRVGKAYRCTSVQVRGAVSNRSTSTISSPVGYLVWDYQPNKVLAAITDILDSVNSAAFPKRENAIRFKIIKKFEYTLTGNNATPASGDEAERIDAYVKLAPDMSTLLTSADTTGVIGDTINGALLWVTVGDVATGTAASSFNVGFRLNFRD